MKENHGDWQSNLSVSNLPKVFLMGMFILMGSLSFAQSTSIARMELNNNVTVRSGLHASYEIHIGHFGFASKQEAEAYFQARDVNYISFVVIDESKVVMNFDLNNPNVAGWTLADWKQALETRASNTTSRTLPGN